MISFLKKKPSIFQVLDNGMPADCYHHAVSELLTNSKFKTYPEAEAYARQWLGGIYSESVFKSLKINIPVENYNATGDSFEIREIRQ
jgi:hypothetical protein